MTYRRPLHQPRPDPPPLNVSTTTATRIRTTWRFTFPTCTTQSPRSWARSGIRTSASRTLRWNLLLLVRKEKGEIWTWSAASWLMYGRGGGRVCTLDIRSRTVWSIVPYGIWYGGTVQGCWIDRHILLITVIIVTVIVTATATSVTSLKALMHLYYLSPVATHLVIVVDRWLPDPKKHNSDK